MVGLTLKTDALVEKCIVAAQRDRLLYSSVELAVVVAKALSYVRVER
jgi:hypothetical protein